ncbi:lamin tail domain-containing protein [Candidatus Dojkabacteria bacterium]|jgi:hypothetical protein|nr:lamin tail domain-containing protein [Candidatus Dojkabacteria bacterium]
MEEFKKLIRNILVLLSLLLLLILFNTKTLAGSNGIKINEVMFDPTGEDLGYEWIELYNPNTVDIPLDNWKIQAAGTHFLDVATLTGTIPANSYYLICELEVVGCNLNLSKLGFQNGGGATDGIQLLDSFGNIIDQIFYDIPNLNNLVGQDGLIIENSKSAIKGKSGESLGRTNFIDTDNSFIDFPIFSTPTPNAENIAVLPDEQLPQTGQNPVWICILSCIFIIFLIFLISDMLSYNIKFKQITHGKSS